MPLFNILLNFSRHLTSTCVAPSGLISRGFVNALCQCGSTLSTNHILTSAVLPGLKGAIALSQAVIAGGAVAGVVLSLHKKHPHDPSQPLMDFDIALMLLPSQLLGLAIG